MALEFSLLGPVSAYFDGAPVAIGPAQQRTVLVALLVDAGKPVPLAELVKRVWGEQPPRRAAEVIRTHLSRLRAALPDEFSVVREHGGYVAQLAPDAVDLHRFRCLVADGDIGRALRLWRGRPFDGLESPWLDDLRTALEIERTEASLLPGPARQTTPALRQLPARPGVFSGRAKEITMLDAASKMVMITAIGGIGGVGKTWLALHWAYANLDRFPDGQLYVNLRGYDAHRPLHHTEAVRHFLDALGVDPNAIPPEPEAQAELYRSVLSTRRMLVLLDNARDSAQVVPLIPGGECTVMVTSRNQLGALVTHHGARRLALDVMTEAEAHELFVEQAGHRRAAAEPGAVTEILTWCAGLPLALGIVTARAVANSALPLAVLADELRDQVHRLDELDTGDGHVNLKAVFSWSYAALGATARRLFALIGSVPTVDVTLPAAAAVMDVEVDDVRQPMRELEAAHLVSYTEPGRYRMHDLVQLYAAEQECTGKPAAQQRLTSFYLHTAHHADRLLDPERPPVRIDPPMAQPWPLADEAAAWEWLEAEQQNIVAMQMLALREERHAAVWQLTAVLDTLRLRRGRFTEQLEGWQHALTAAERAGELLTMAKAHRNLGHLLVRLGNLQESHEHLTAGLALAEQLGDVEVQNHCHHQLVRTNSELGDNRKALEHAIRCTELVKHGSDRVFEAKNLNQVGYVHALLGEYEQARDYCSRALALAEEIDSLVAQADIQDSLGYIAYQTGDHTAAIRHYRAALDLIRRTGSQAEEPETLVALGKVHQEAGDTQAARQVWQQALELFTAQRRTVDMRHVQALLEN
ncbi:ATP-binding protein [Kibdelosporangium phytohabitans]|uniref:OmpR/PhoB-type domain-containing protein n=1 Tax=Kibdelosporangium phytohabitans TaxID=860235 RepID=A0A0N9I874_9PSEU|nr:tetratricopeptide repeat protein [Kibdelosporangium phytohabitans]ALG12486.1 hypothetical protein AOZ06_41500 [Kibdelosporangium phytohabitans]MBE1464080.1 tetratricopeptide (TPR) repeat protein [Kibdelosporangium phytohabitans]